MHSSSSLVVGGSLDSVSTVLTLQSREVALQLDVYLIVSGVGGSLLHDAVLSAETESQLLVSSGELTHEDLGICSALGGPYLYYALHSMLLCFWCPPTLSCIDQVLAAETIICAKTSTIRTQITFLRHCRSP